VAMRLAGASRRPPRPPPASRGGAASHSGVASRG
jgi:hypothetical protein